MKVTKLSGFLLLLFFTLLVFAGCGEADGEGGDVPDNEDQNNLATEEDWEIVIDINNWAENIAVSHMWEILLEEQGFDVTIESMDKAPVWLGVSRGELDIAPEVWLPHTDKALMEEYGDDVEMHEIWYENTNLGLVVPEYMDIDSMEDLNAISGEIDDRIVGIDPGASLTQMTEEAVEAYDLDLELVTSSDPAMMAELSSVYTREEPIVVTLWSPHWAFADYDLKYLEDPQGVYGEPDDIHYMTRTGFSDDMPEVVEWMDNWEMDDESLGSLMSEIKDSDPETGAQTWIDDNRELVDGWID